MFNNFLFFPFYIVKIIEEKDYIMTLINNVYIILFIIFIIFVTINTISFNTYMLTKNIEDYNNYIKEPFAIFSNSTKTTADITDIYNNTTQKYKDGYNYNSDDNKITNYSIFKELNDIDNNNPLTAFGCIKINNNSDNNIYTFVDNFKKNNNIVSNVYKSHVVNYNNILQIISNDVDKVLLESTSSFLKGPVYVVISQAPYIRLNNELVVAKYDSVNNMKASYKQNNNDISIGDRSLLTYIAVIYPYYYYKNNNIVKYNDNTGLKLFQEYFKNINRDKLCFMECNGVNDISCGCLTNNIEKDDLENYRNICVDYNDKVVDYAMVYNINEFNKLFFKKIQLIDFSNYNSLDAKKIDIKNMY